MQIYIKEALQKYKEAWPPSFVFKHQDNLANMYYLKGRNRNQTKIFQECGASMPFKCQKEQSNSIQYAV